MTILLTIYLKEIKMGEISIQEAKQITSEAYIYAFPMLMGYRYAFASFLMPGIPSYRGPVNALHGKAATFDHTFKDVVTPNADTPYSMALVDLRLEPVVLQVPAVKDRYYVFQFVDLFGTNPHFIGSRSTGSDEGTYLMVGPRWQGQVGDKFDGILRFGTDLAFVIGRPQLLGMDDIPALAKVMASYKLQILSAYREQDSPAAQVTQWPIWNDEASRDERFIGYLNFLLTLCQPIHPSEADMMSRFTKIGIGPDQPFEAETLDREVRDAIRGGNDVIEAMYPSAYEDSDGKPLDGTHRYQITFTTLPPTKAFWSVTMYDKSYDGTAGYLVENPINRYLINSTTPGLEYGKDGSLTITIQHEQPQDYTQKANWLPDLSIWSCASTGPNKLLWMAPGLPHQSCKSDDNFPGFRVSFMKNIEVSV
jgi:hypothetical protein